MQDVEKRLIFAPEDYKAHWRPEMSDEAYHADKTAVNSGSLVRMTKSPRAFHAAFFLGKNPEPTKAMKFGSLAHMALLQGSKFKEKYVVMPEIVGYTKDGKPTTSGNAKDVQDKKAKWLADQPEGAIITTEADRERLFAMIDSVLSHEQAVKLLSQGQPEVAGYWRDPETGIRCRIKPDFISFGVNSYLEVKTTTDSIWEHFRRSVESLRYDIQVAMYEEGIHQITGHRPEHSVWLAIESQYPFEVACFEVPDQYKSTGLYEFKEGLKRIKECVLEDKWPQREQEIIYGEMSPWFFSKYDDKGAFNELTI